MTTWTFRNIGILFLWQWIIDSLRKYLVEGKVKKGAWATDRIHLGIRCKDFGASSNRFPISAEWYRHLRCSCLLLNLLSHCLGKHWISFKVEHRSGSFHQSLSKDTPISSLILIWGLKTPQDILNKTFPKDLTMTPDHMCENIHAYNMHKHVCMWRLECHLGCHLSGVVHPLETGLLTGLELSKVRLAGCPVSRKDRLSLSPKCWDYKGTLPQLCLFVCFFISCFEDEIQVLTLTKQTLSYLPSPAISPFALYPQRLM